MNDDAYSHLDSRVRSVILAYLLMVGTRASAEEALKLLIVRALMSLAYELDESPVDITIALARALARREHGWPV